jgi:uncharacterized membrane protein YhaH (DUF805 family)
VLGTIALLVLLALEGEPGANEYGEKPAPALPVVP